MPRGICLCVWEGVPVCMWTCVDDTCTCMTQLCHIHGLCMLLWECPWRLVFVRMWWPACVLCMLTEAVGNWDVCMGRVGWEDLLKCAQLCRKQLWHLCQSTANKHLISRSVLSLQTLHIFHSVEQHSSLMFCLLCIQKVQPSPNELCVCHSTYYQIRFFTCLPPPIQTWLPCHFFSLCVWMNRNT